jgi:hypothetical protein
VQARRAGSRRYLFRSPSTDLRFLDATLLEPGQVHGYPTSGAMAGVVGLVVGFSSNFLSVVRADNRLVLHNGYHRACALRSLGLTHAPALIQTVTRPDELELVAKGVVCQDPAFFFRSARPPLLKDFFDPRLTRLHPTHRQIRMVEVSFEVRDYFINE